MKILVIPDLHGKDCWQAIVNVFLEEVDQIIFLGDYVDAFDKTDEEITTNLQNIIEFKENYSNKVVLLLGNHDIQYIWGYSQYGCSGFRSGMFATWNLLFQTNYKLFRMAYQHKNWLFTHAGVSSGWMKTL